MKYKYKNLIPFVLILFMAAAWYQIIDAAVTEDRQYKEYVEQARNFAKDGVLVDSLENYTNAIQMRDSVELRTEVSDLYIQNDLPDDAMEYAENIVSVFPQNAKSYEYLMGLYLNQELYAKCFQLYDKANKLGVVTESLKNTISEIAYRYQVTVSGIAEVSVFSNDICAVKYGEYWGFVDVSGKSIIGAEFTAAGDFTGDKTYVKPEEGEPYFMDASGNKRGVFPEGVPLDEVGNDGSNMYSLKSQGSLDYYSFDKQKVLGGYSDGTTFYNGYAVVLNENGYGLIDASGNQIGADSYLSVARDESGIATRNERAFFQLGDSWIMVTMEGEQVGSDSYEEVKPFYSDGYAAVKKDGKWGFVDADGKMCISPQYDEARSFSYGHAAVKKDGKWGFIDGSGTMVIEPVFEDARDMNSSGNIFVKENGGWEMISLYRYNY